jgi:hypothetical protein
MAEVFDIVEPRTPEGLVLYLRARESQRLFRVAPVRDPDQPRLWCFRVDWCARPGPIGGAGDRAELCVAARGMTREQLMEALQLLRESPEAWLGESRQRDLRRWLQAKSVAPVDGPQGTPADGRERTATSTDRRLKQEGLRGQETTISPANAAGQAAGTGD